MKQVLAWLALFSLSGYAQAQFSLKGKVTDDQQTPLAGAHVIMQNTYYKTVTDKNGLFNLTGIKPGLYALQISYMGYEPHADTLSMQGDSTLSITLREAALVGDEVIISAVRATRNTPTTFTLMNKAEISRRNLAQDLPYMLSHEPSVVTTSDAGAGIGYTGLRIRGSDITRINVTINGIPLNDPESHAVYWVDIPDFASSVNSLQLQRGVGSSTNGAGAFGASMNLETNTFQKEPFGMISLAGGSFNTWKTSFQLGTGLLNNHWYFEGRGSAIGTDGYIDRASSALHSFFIQGGYYNEKTLVKFIAFTGSEKTYQAWYGTDAATLSADRTFNWAGALYDENWNVTGFYDNQTDNYQQNHYQLHISRRLAPALNLNLSGHYTYGRGYYEEYKQDELFSDYGFGDLYYGTDTLTTTDLIRRRWLNNHYYGLTWSLRRQKNKTDIIIGGAYHEYSPAHHYGEVIWAEHAEQITAGEEYYRNTSFKNDINVFAKAVWSPVQRISLYGDMQYRHITYRANGIESHLNPVYIRESFHFLNPKAGISYHLKSGTLYASYSIAHREPIRDDYLDARPGESPEPETLGNLEVGMRKSDSDLQYAVNYFLMNYVNQLVLTGEINDDGAYIRKNSGRSYRTGIEMAASYTFKSFAELGMNLSLSLNKTDYRQVNNEGSIIAYENRDISFSPRATGGAQLMIYPFSNFEIHWLLRFVGKQYLDNTGNHNLMLDPYLINDLRLAYLIKSAKMPEIECTVLVNNVFNTRYESNGYVYENSPYYYPQAGIHFLAGVVIGF